MDFFDSLPDPLRPPTRAKWEAFVDAAAIAGIRPPADTTILRSLARVFALSSFVADNCIRTPRLLIGLIDAGDLQSTYDPTIYAERLSQDLTGVEDDIDLARVLRMHRRREMVRIAWRDLAGWADLSETATALSAFADACLDQSVSFLHRRLCDELGTPVDSRGQQQRLVVVAMGKLGAAELNFSSDIDLVFAYPEPGTTRGGKASVSNEEFFSRLCRRLVHVIGAPSPDGIVFRVDLRLRPNGENGPLVMDFDNMEEYYQRQGREWERYAWIRARIAAGDQAAGERLLDTLRPFVYRRYLDYSAFEALREMKAMIVLEVRQKRIGNNIKIGAGGIREIEFFGQTFQLIRGGVAPELQARQILTVLDVLHGKKTISQQTRDELAEAYTFFRNTEHHLQEASDQQTHTLPSGERERLQLAISMDFETWESYLRRIKDHRAHVEAHFGGLLSVPEDRQAGEWSWDEATGGIWPNLADTDRCVALLTSLGFDQGEEVLGLLRHLESDPATRSLSTTGRSRLARLMPLVMKEAVTSPHPIPVLNRILNLLQTIQQRTNYLSLLLENPSALTHLVSLAEASPWIVSFLSRHPVLLDELLDPRTLYTPPEKADFDKEIRHDLSLVPRDDLEYQIEQLCIFKQVNVLRIAAADVTGALPLMRTSDHLTELAETVISQVLDLSWHHLCSRHGKPTSASDPGSGGRGFAVIAYGKLGGIELGYGSDLDLVFVHSGRQGQTDGTKRPIENALFYSRLGQRIIHVLTAHTRAGRIYETDVRLRPSGDSGVLVSHIDGYKSYQMTEAWTWEHQALIRARAICGDARLCADFEEIRLCVLTQTRDMDQLRKDVGDMRERMRRESRIAQENAFDVKQEIGGMVDIEFIVQFLVLMNARRHPSLTRWTDNVRLLESLSEADIIDGGTAQTLRIAYLAYRSAAHRLSLQERPAAVPLDEFTDHRREIARIWRDVVGC